MTVLILKTLKIFRIPKKDKLSSIKSLNGIVESISMINYLLKTYFLAIRFVSKTSSPEIGSINVVLKCNKISKMKIRSMIESKVLISGIFIKSNAKLIDKGIEIAW